MRFQNIEDAVAFYKRYANCVGFSVRKSSTTKNKSGKIWKVFFYSKQGYREPHKAPPQSAVALANAISRARVNSREGCNVCMVVSSMNDGQFESLKEIPACFKVDMRTQLAAKKPIFELDTILSTSYTQMGKQNTMIFDAWSRLYKCMDLAGYNALSLAIGVTPSCELKKIGNAFDNIASAKRTLKENKGESMLGFYNLIKAIEVTQIDEGLFIRLDMPGVA
ncbi:hypothetical protein Cgig2_011598 [Carnegiea gigantea]|uniref:FAR1 domain-containing protein n=1 Tax=Carnegiea gigantea TaxID=171969 RepID=A0A9Q1JN94_9CARY|nr:hypothetical protein Cgig2_011598 [Carnegiea gigantea]